MLISADAALELSPHQMGPWNKILLQRDFKEIRYLSASVFRSQQKITMLCCRISYCRWAAWVWSGRSTIKAYEILLCGVLAKVNIAPMKISCYTILVISFPFTIILNTVLPQNLTTIKSHYPWNVAVCFCQLISSLKILPHGPGWAATYGCTCALYIQ